MARRNRHGQSYVLESGQFPMNQSNGKRALPSWLDGRTIAMLTTTITVALTLGTMMQTAHARLGGEIAQLRQDMNGMRQEFGQQMNGMRQEFGKDMNGLRQELRQDMNGLRQELSADIKKARSDLSNDINKLDDRLRSVEVGVTSIQTTIVGFDARLRVVEQHVRHATKTPDHDRNDG